MVDEDTLKVAYDIVLNNAKSHKSFLRKTHWEIHIPKPKEVWLQIQIKYQRRKYKIPDCCLPMKNPDWYRYCMKALDDGVKYSQRHGINCPHDCGKCGNFHHDYASVDAVRLEADGEGLLE